MTDAARTVWRRVLYTSISVCVLLTALFAATLFASVTWTSSSMRCLNIGRGAVSTYSSSHSQGWTLEWRTGPIVWNPQHEPAAEFNGSYPLGWPHMTLMVPIRGLAVCPFMLALTAWLNIRRGSRKGICIKCGYPRDGLQPNAPCPECGIPSHAAA